jgi:hypothetical protein
MSSFRHTTASFASTDHSSGRNDEDDGDDEIANLHYVVEGGHCTLEQIDERCDDETDDERREKRPDTASVKEPLPGLLRAIVGMCLTHPDNHSVLLWVPLIVQVAAAIANVASQVTPIAFQLTPVLKCLALVSAMNIPANLTPV